MNSSESGAFRYFLTEYKKRLPETEENKDFHEHLDYMINYFKDPGTMYEDRWDAWLSMNDERYWRNPHESEKREIKIKHLKKEREKIKNGNRTIITMASVFLAAIAGYGMLGMVFTGFTSPVVAFLGIFILQGVITIFHEMEIFPFSCWSWLY